MDVTLRLEPIILDIERTREPILIVGKFFHCLMPVRMFSFIISLKYYLRSPRHS